MGMDPWGPRPRPPSTPDGRIHARTQSGVYAAMKLSFAHDDLSATMTPGTRRDTVDIDINGASTESGFIELSFSSGNVSHKYHLAVAAGATGEQIEDAVLSAIKASPAVDDSFEMPRPGRYPSMRETHYNDNASRTGEAVTVWLDLRERWADQ
jgi:hypothetical protein